MDKNEKIVYGSLAATAVGAIAWNYFKVSKEEREKRRKIKADTRLEIKAIREAKNRVLDRIEAGHYSGRGFDVIIDDFQFENIIARNEW